MSNWRAQKQLCDLGVVSNDLRQVCGDFLLLPRCTGGNIYRFFD